MNVSELIRILSGFPQDLDIAYEKFSEYCLMEPGDISHETLGEARSDGWVPDYRVDKPVREYIVFPGN